MPNAQTKAAATSGQKKERKAPVRRAPKRSDYPSAVAWAEAVLEFEKAEATKASEDKIARLDKRIQSKTEAIGKLRTELDKLTAERAELAGFGHGEDDMSEDEHLAAEGKD